ALPFGCTSAKAERCPCSMTTTIRSNPAAPSHDGVTVNRQQKRRSMASTYLKKFPLTNPAPDIRYEKIAAAVAELADALDSGSSTHKVCRFNSCRPHFQEAGVLFHEGSGFLFVGINENPQRL